MVVYLLYLQAFKRFISDVHLVKVGQVAPIRHVDNRGPNNASAIVVLCGILHWYSYARAEELQFLFPVYSSFCVQSLMLVRTFNVKYNIACLSHLIIAYNSRNHEGNKKYFHFCSLRCSP